MTVTDPVTAAVWPTTDRGGLYDLTIDLPVGPWWDTLTADQQTDAARTDHIGANLRDELVSWWASDAGRSADPTAHTTATRMLTGCTAFDLGFHVDVDLDQLGDLP